jgi:alpha-amylase
MSSVNGSPACYRRTPMAPRHLAFAAVCLAASACGSLDYPAQPGFTASPVDLPPAVPDAAAPPNVPARPVMMQAFYWDVPQQTPAGGWWKSLESKAGELANLGITAVWIPPPYKGHAGVNDVGYGVYDRYDLGEFDQKGTVKTRYGTLAELTSAIGALHGAGVSVYADIVMNHMMGGDGQEQVTLLGGATANVPTRFDFAGRGQAYSTFAWRKDQFNGIQQGGSWKQWHDWDFAPYDNGDAYDNLLGTEIRYADPAVRAETIAWGKWITEKLSLDGYRLDAIKHIHMPFVNAWLDAVKGDRFAVSEVWTGDAARLVTYADMTGGKTHLFDVALHYELQHMGDGDGAWDMRGLKHAGFVDKRPDLAVTFVDNHDTVNVGALHSPVTKLKMLAYAFILTHDGIPCVFYKDHYEDGLGAEIAKLVAIRKAHAFGPGREYDESDEDVYVYAREGEGSLPGLLLFLNDGAAAERAVASPFPNATLVDATGHVVEEVKTDAAGKGTFKVPAKGYAVWVPKGT